MTRISGDAKGRLLTYIRNVVMSQLASSLEHILPVSTQQAVEEFLAAIGQAFDTAAPITIDDWGRFSENVKRAAATFFARRFGIDWSAIRQATGLTGEPVDDISKAVLNEEGLVSVEPATTASKAEQNPRSELIALAMEHGAAEDDAIALVNALLGDRRSLSDEELETMKQVLIAYIETKVPAESEARISRELFISTHMPMLILAGYAEVEARSLMDRMLGEKTELTETEFSQLSNQLMSEIHAETTELTPAGGVSMDVIRALLDPAFKRAGWTESQISSVLTDIWERHGYGEELTTEQVREVVSEINALLEQERAGLYQPSEKEAWNNFIHQEILTAIADIESELGWTLPLSQENTIYDEIAREADEKLEDAITKGITYPSIDAFRSELQTIIHSKARSLIAGARLAWLKRESNRILRSKIDQTWSEYSRNLVAELQSRGMPAQTIQSDLSEIWLTIENSIEPTIEDIVKAKPLASPDAVAESAYQTVMGRVEQSMNNLRSRVYAVPRQRVYTEIGMRRWSELLPQIIRTNYGSMISEKAESTDQEERFIEMLADKAMEVAMSNIGQPFSATSERDSYWDMFSGAVATAVSRFWDQLWTALKR